LPKNSSCAVGDPHALGAGVIHPHVADHLGLKRAECLGLHQDHAVVVEPDAPVTQRELQRACQIVEGGCRAFVKQEAVAALKNPRASARGLGQGDALPVFTIY
jgi:hypothetical protein